MRFTVKRSSTRSFVRSFTFRSRDPRIPNRRDVNVGHGCHSRDTRKLGEARAAKRYGRRRKYKTGKKPSLSFIKLGE